MHWLRKLATWAASLFAPHPPAVAVPPPPPLRWDGVPEAFHYLRAAVEACGETRVAHFDHTLGRHVPPIERLTEEQLDLIGAARTESRRRGDRAEIEQWCAPPERPRPSIHRTMWAVQGMLFLFDQVDDERHRRSGDGRL
ncbi:hypothetical protein [Alienimonas californiensis]|uniref:Uncharacterized protein n=1 Tax=Alienimonas californiensis TaxID=2527989 RepID=A0A517P9X5_9PLAN|nr:hypothetical protein [Alienimonas californiensis]QDT16168.1 hypothetical protein CA12_22660 [Alienimonas californiensis]